MTRDEVIKLAIETGVADPDLSDEEHAVTDYGDSTDSIVKFAELVASAEREEILNIAPQDLPGGVEASAYPHEVWEKLMDSIRARGEK